MSHKKDNYLSKALVAGEAVVRSGKGKNIIPPPEREPLWRAYLAKFKDPIIIVLLVVFFLSVMFLFCYFTTRVFERRRYS